MASLYKKGLIYWIQYYHNGKRYQESLKTKSRQDAKYLLAKKSTELIEKPFKSNLDKVAINYILKRYDVENVHLKSKKTRINDDIRLSGYISGINAQFLQDINEVNLRNYILSRLDSKEIGVITANNIVRNVKTFLNWCVSQRLLVYNHISKFKQYKEPKTTKRFLSEKEIEIVLNLAKKEKIYPAIATAIYSGMRLGELERLQWKDIDFERNIITVHISKSGRFRIIPLSGKLKEILNPKESNDYCFKFSNRWKEMGRIVKVSEIPRFGWHTFRHTFASHLLQNGVSIYKVAQWLGHSTTCTTEIYGHLQPVNDNDINKL